MSKCRNHVNPSTFARWYGFKRSNEKGFREHLKHLQQVGAIRIVQGGYRGHSACHSKKVEVILPEIVDAYFRPKAGMTGAVSKLKVEEPDFEKGNLEFWCMAAWKNCPFKGHKYSDVVFFCKSPNVCKHQKAIPMDCQVYDFWGLQ